MRCVSDNNMAWTRRRAECSTTGDCVIQATVPTGFESFAAEEVEEIFQTQCTTTRGKITFRTPTEKVKDILKLGGIDHCRVQILHVPSFGFTMDPAECLSSLQQLVKRSQWREGLDVWSQFQNSHSQTDFAHCSLPDCSLPDSSLPDSSLPDSLPEDQDLIGEVCYSAHMPTPHDGHRMSKSSLEQDGEHGVMDHVKPTFNFQSDGVGKSEGVGELVGNGHRDLCSIDKPNQRTDVDSVDEAQSKKVSLPSVISDTFCTETRNSRITIAEDFSHTTSESSISEIPRRFQKSSVDLLSTVTESKRRAMKPKERLDGQDSIKENHPHPRKPRFRVTCHRTGQDHCFDSMSAAASFGRAVQNAFGWQVDLNSFDVEIVLQIQDDEVFVSIALTPDSLHRRDLVALGVTTLRPTIAYNMLRMVNIQPGHVVCDPLCGTSSIPIQGALRFAAFQLSGDSHRVAMEKTARNINHLNMRQAAQGRGGLLIDALRWNACSLPLRDGLVDAFVSDLPFGKRVGRRSGNLKLYSRVLGEMTRCGNPTGRAALLTADVKNMTKALKAQKHWSVLRRCGCNIGGLAAAVFVLHRTYVTHQSQGKQFESCPAPHNRTKG